MKKSTLLISLMALSSVSGLSAFADSNPTSPRDANKNTITSEIKEIQVVIDFASDAQKNCNFDSVYNSLTDPDQIASDIPTVLSSLAFSITIETDAPKDAEAKMRIVHSDLDGHSMTDLHASVYSVQGCQDILPVLQKINLDLNTLLTTFD